MHVAVIEPADGATVPAGDAITVRVNADGAIASGPEDSSGGHLHLSVDDKLQQMPYATTADLTLVAGAHTVTVEYVDDQHLSSNPPIRHTIKVRGTWRRRNKRLHLTSREVVRFGHGSRGAARDRPASR